MLQRLIFCIFILLFDGPPKSLAARLLDTSVSCDQENFVLSLNFDTTFRGIVYSEEGFPNCVYVNGSMLSQKVYILKIPLEGCETKRNHEGNFENSIIVQDHVSYLQSTDKKYLLTCIPSNPEQRHDSMITVDFGGVTVDNRHTTTEIIIGTLPPNALMPAANLKYHVEIRAGHGIDAFPLSAPLNIGDPISYIVKLEKPVADSQIGRCWATDSKSNLELSDDRGCTVQPKGRIWTNFEKREDSKQIIFVNKIKAWAFPSSNEVNIFCNLRICVSRNCNFSNCSEPSGKRLRRHFGHPVSDLTEIRTISTKLRIRRAEIQSTFPISSIDVITTDPDDSAICLSLLHFGLIGGCVFAFLVLFSLIGFIFLPTKMSKLWQSS